MDAVLLFARLVLAGVFGLSGFTKLSDRPGTLQALRDFGLPTRLAGLLAPLLPVLELTAALLLLSSSTALWGALGATLLLGVFTAAIAFNLLRGHRPQCHCFGQLSTSPISWKTLVRNVALAGLAGLVLWRGAGYAVTSGAGVMWSAGLLGVLLYVAMGWLVISLWRQQGRLLLRIEALESSSASQLKPGTVGRRVGLPAPEFTATDLHGKRRVLSGLLRHKKPVLLLFTDPACGPCTDLLPQVGRWQKRHAEVMTLALVSRGDAAANMAKAAEYGLTTVLLQEKSEISDAFEVKGTPSAVLIKVDGTIGSATAGGARAIEELVASLVPTLVPPKVPPKEAVSQVHLRIGQAAPSFSLADLDGNMIHLDSFRGSDTLLLFWNPSCSFCQRMLGDFSQWVVHRPIEAPRLVLVSTGSLDANRALGLNVPILLDKDFAVGRAYGVRGTPAAVLMDKGGKIASAVAVGKDAVLSLVALEHHHNKPKATTSQLEPQLDMG